MQRKRLAGLAGVIVSTAIGALFTASGAQAQTANTLTIPAPTMVHVLSSSHNPPVCGDAVVQGTEAHEFSGTLYDAAGSFLFPVIFPPNATVTSLGVSVHDFTDPGDVHVYLVRKSTGATSLLTDKYLVMASVSSSGFEDSVRKFTTHKINAAVIDGTKFGYFVELVNCDSTIQPVSVQIGFTTP